MTNYEEDVVLKQDEEEQELVETPHMMVAVPFSDAAPVESERPSLRSSAIRCIVAAAALVISGGFYLIAAGDPRWISDTYKHFSRGVMHLVGSVWSVFPFSSIEFLIYAAVLGVPALIVLTAVRSKKHRYALRRFARLFSHLLLVAVMLLSMFLCTWAPNYRSAGMAYELGLEVRERSVDTLKAALDELTAELNAAAEELPRSADGSVDWADFHRQSVISRGAWEALAEAEPFFDGCHPLPTKPVAMSRAMSYTGITGVFIPFTAEASVNADFPDPGRIFTMCHETAHFMGCAAENEANFAAYLACRASDSPLARYSGYLSAWIYCYNALCRVDMEAAFERWYQLPKQAVADFDQRGEYWAQFEGPVQKAADSVNDTYLKVMNQPSGIRSYGEVVDLILADFVARTGYVEQ